MTAAPVRVRIVCDKAPEVGRRVKVIDVETGREIGGVRSFSIDASADSIVTATLELIAAEFDLMALAQIRRETVTPPPPPDRDNSRGGDHSPWLGAWIIGATAVALAILVSMSQGLK